MAFKIKINYYKSASYIFNITSLNFYED